jgi:hypothetical protein
MRKFVSFITFVFLDASLRSYDTCRLLSVKSVKAKREVSQESIVTAILGVFRQQVYDSKWVKNAT